MSILELQQTAEKTRQLCCSKPEKNLFKQKQTKKKGKNKQTSSNQTLYSPPHAAAAAAAGHREGRGTHSRARQNKRTRQETN